MRQLLFGLKFSSVLSILALLVACAEQPVETAETTGSGQAPAPPTTVTQPPVTQVETKPEAPSIVPGGQEDLVLNVGDRVFFDFDKSDLTSEAQDTVEKVVAWMKTYPDVTLTLEGHCDERGTREYNLALGERRANSVRSYMEALGIDSSRLSTISFGKERPAVLGSNEASWAQNRRSVFVVN